MWNAEDAADEALAMVVRTGINSTLGTLVKQLIVPTHLPQADPFMIVSFLLLLHLQLLLLLTP